MKRFLTIALLGVVALGVSSVANANFCAHDATPAATVLFPFVSYDYEAGQSATTTIFTLTNTSSEAQIVHITVWSDYSVAILDYNVILTGYDVVRQNIADILANGILPGPLTGDTIWEEDNQGPEPVPLGPYSPGNQLNPVVINNLDEPDATWDGNDYPDLNNHQWMLNCNPDWENGGWLGSPNNYTFPIDSGTRTFFRGFFEASQTADKGYWCADPDDDVSDLVGDTWYTTRDSGPVWVYITADVVGTCNKDFPDSVLSYWVPYEEGDNEIGTMKYDNVLIGDVIWLNGEGDQNFSEADNAVHLEALDVLAFGSGLGTTATSAGNASFYHRYTLDAMGAQAFSDGREPLPSAWAFRYQVVPDIGANTWIRAFKAGTEFGIVYDLDPDLAAAATPPDYINASSCQPYTYYSWDEDENVAAGITGGGQPPWSGSEVPPTPVPNLLPLETQEVSVENFAIIEDEDTGDSFGWMLFVWPMSNGSAVDMYQTWMGVKYSGFDTYTAGLSGAVMANYNCFDNQALPLLGWNMYENLRMVDDN